VGTTVLVNLPLRGPDRFDFKKGQRTVAVSGGGQVLPHRVLSADFERASVLVSVGQGGRGQEHFFYFGASKTGAPADGNLRDLKPVRMTLWKAGGKSTPDSWAKMFYLHRMAERTRVNRLLPGFGEVKAFPDAQTEEQKKKRQRHWLLSLRSYVNCPEEGIYRFALECRDAGFLLVDGEVVAARTGGYPSEGQVVGTPGVRKTGPHLVEVLNFSKEPFLARIRWQRPGRPDMVTVPGEALLTADEASSTRVETADRTLHPDFSYEVLPAYSFRGAAAVFVPVRFKNTSVNWTAQETQCRWVFGAGPGGAEGSAAGDSPLHVFTGLGVHRAVLEVRDALGFRSRCDRAVDCRRVRVAEHAVDLEVTSLPAVCYATDVVEPVFRLVGALPAGTSLDVWWEVARRSGEKDVSRRAIELSGGAEEVRMVSAKAGLLSSIKWRVSHWETDLGSGTILLAAPPFTNLPVRVEGDRLYDGDGNRLILVPAHLAKGVGQAAIRTEQAFGRLVCVDDSLAAPGLPSSGRFVDFFQVLARIVDGPDRPVVRYAPLPVWDESPRACGFLLKLVQIPALIVQDGEVDVAIISVGLQDIMTRQDPGRFERQIAALGDLVSESMGCPVILVTPPPYPGNAGRFRPVAAAIRRAADARGIPVADLYTAFSGTATRPSVLFSDGLALSEQGHELAGEIIARTLLAE